MEVPVWHRVPRVVGEAMNKSTSSHLPFFTQGKGKRNLSLFSRFSFCSSAQREQAGKLQLNASATCTNSFVWPVHEAFSVVVDPLVPTTTSRDEENYYQWGRRKLLLVRTRQ